MSGQNVRAHTSQTNRAKARDGGDRKVAFKSVVYNPFQVQWPSVPVNIQNTVLASVVNMLSGVSDYNSTRERARKRKIQSDAPQNGPETKKGRTDRSTNDEDGSATAHCRAESLLAAEPPILRSVVIGINEVTRKLEDIARSYRSTLCTDAQKATPSKPPPACSNLVIACRGDVDPPLLIGHLPNLIAACNSTRQRNATSGSRLPGTWLVPMSKGAENILAEATGLRRVSVLLVESKAPQFSAIASLLENVPLLRAPWLTPSNLDQPSALVPTHIKQMQTSAPKDMKAAKERRAKERAAAKRARPKHPSKRTLTTAKA